MGSAGAELQTCRTRPGLSTEGAVAPPGPGPHGAAAPGHPLHLGRGSGGQGGACPLCPHPGGVPLTEVQLRPAPWQRCRPLPPRGCELGGHPAPHRGARVPAEGTEVLSPHQSSEAKPLPGHSRGGDRLRLEVSPRCPPHPPGPPWHLPQGCCALWGRWSAGHRLPPGRGDTGSGFSLGIAAGAVQALLQPQPQPPHLVLQRPDGLAAAGQMSQ